MSEWRLTSVSAEAGGNVMALAGTQGHGVDIMQKLVS